MKDKNNIYNNFDCRGDINKNYIHEIVSEACFNKVLKHLPLHIFDIVWNHVDYYPNENVDVVEECVVKLYHKGGRNRKNNKIKAAWFELYDIRY